MTSSLFLPRKVLRLCSPRAQRIASATLDLPDPFGPTMAVKPLFSPSTIPEKINLFLLAKDLKP